MKVFEGKGLGDMYYSVFRYIRDNGVDVTVRGHACREAPTPTTLVYTQPGYCWMNIPGRRFNPFFALAEVMWILTGRGDIDWIAKYNKTMRNFNDGSPYNNGAYGLRIRAWDYYEGQSCENTLDQIEHVVRKLKEDSFTRQAIISLWSADKDNGITSVVASKDIPCLAGETPLWSPEGTLPIKEVAAKFKTGEITKWPVYAVDPETSRLKIAWATRVWKSGKKKLTKLTFDDGSVLRLTDDHILFKRSAPLKHKWKDIVELRVGDLKVGDRVLATQKFYSPKGHEQIKKLLNKNTCFSNIVKTHRAYAELLYGKLEAGYDVHHANEIKTDNRSANLIRLSHGEHAALKMLGAKNPMFHLTKQQRKARAAKQSESLSSWHTGISKERRAQISKTQSKARHRYLKTIQNHVIVKIEKEECADVFDFTVPKYHAAVVGTGVVVHNCNNWVGYRLRDGVLHQTVLIRSNDLIWGTPYNAIQFTHLHALVAGELGVQMGTLTYVINNLHYYRDLYPEALAAVEKGAGQTFETPGFPGAQKMEGFCTVTDDELAMAAEQMGMYEGLFKPVQRRPLAMEGDKNYWYSLIPAVCGTHFAAMQEAKAAQQPCRATTIAFFMSFPKLLRDLALDFYSTSKHPTIVDFIRRQKLYEGEE